MGESVSLGKYKWLAILFLIAGPLLQYLEQWISPNVDAGSLADMLPLVAQHSNAYLITCIVGFFGGALFLPLFYVLFHLTKDRSPILAHIGVSLSLLGVLGSTSMHIMQIFLQQMALPGFDVAQMQKVLHQVENGPLTMMVLPLFMVGMFGTMLIMTIALWKSRTVPRIPLILIILFMIPDFIGLHVLPPHGPLNLHIVMLLAFGWIAYRVYQMPKQEWAQPRASMGIWV